MVLTDEQLFSVSVAVLLRAAQGEANGGDKPSYDASVALLAESRRRSVKAGHGRDCPNGIYRRAYRQAMSESGFQVPVPELCCCRNAT